MHSIVVYIYTYIQYDLIVSVHLKLLQTSAHNIKKKKNNLLNQILSM